MTPTKPITIAQAFRLWLQGTPLKPLYRRAGRTLRAPFIKLAGGSAADWKRALAAHAKAKKQRKENVA